MGTPSEILGRVTAAARERLESSPSLESLREGQASRAQHAALLRATHEVHEGLARSLAASGDAASGALAHRVAGRLGALRGDLAGLGEDLHAVDAPALRAALFSQRARRSEPSELVGYAYVIESTRHVRLESREAPSVEALRELIDSALGHEAAIEAAVSGARRALEGLEAILSALGALRDQALAEELNPEAGGHSVPSDLREVEAALLAGESSWRRFSYYEARYGARGRRFTRSDSAWLASLARTSENETISQVLWLGRVLASRGMPPRPASGAPLASRGVIGWRVIAEVERPLRGWRRLLIAAMVALLGLAFAIPSSRSFFELSLPEEPAIYAVTAAASIVGWLFVGLGARIGRRLSFGEAAGPPAR